MSEQDLANTPMTRRKHGAILGGENGNTSQRQAAGYRLLQDPQMHFSRKRDVRTHRGRPGRLNMADCACTATLEASEQTDVSPESACLSCFWSTCA